jgi:hypothetical protein
MNSFSSLLAKALRALSIFFLLGSCTIEIDRQLDRIEQELSFQPDSAYAQLSRLESDKFRSSSRRARYALLLSLARDKSYIDVSDDSLAQVAVSYYQRHGTKYERMLALYSLGRVQRNAGNNTGAIISFLQSKELAEGIADHHYLGLSTRNIGDLYKICQDEDSELEYYTKSSDAFLTDNNVRYAAYSQLEVARAYMAKGMITVADSILVRIAEYARYEDEYLYCYALMDRALNMMAIDVPAPELTISLYREADSLKLIQKGTLDLVTIAQAYNLLNISDSVAFYSLLAERAMKTRLDSVHYFNNIYALYRANGEYEKANEQMRRAIQLHNSIVFDRENQQIANAISSFNQQEAQRQSELAQYRFFLIILSLVAFVALLCVLILVVVNRRSQIREKNRIILEREHKIEEDLACIQEMSDQLRVVRDDQSEMAITIKNLIGEKIAIVKQCADAYDAVKNEPKENLKDPYRYLDEDPIKKKTWEMNQFLKALEAFRKDDSLFQVLEDSVNKWRGNIMVKLRLSCAKDSMKKPRFDEEDFRILMLFYAGIPDRAIAFLMDMTCPAVRTRKTRYKERLLQEDISDGVFFVREMAKNSTVSKM